MKSKKQIIKKFKEELLNKRKISNLHLRCRGINKSGYVTNKEHISGEKLSSIEGVLYALEWMLDESDSFWDDFYKKGGFAVRN